MPKRTGLSLDTLHELLSSLRDRKLMVDDLRPAFLYRAGAYLFKFGAGRISLTDFNPLLIFGKNPHMNL